MTAAAASGRVIALLLALLLPASPALAADWPSDKLGAASAWDDAYDARAQSRFIPIQLILPGPWDGARSIDLPAASFTDPDGDRWKGPLDDRDAFTDQAIRVYERSRYTKAEGHIDQRFAVRAEADGLGRMSDSRFGGLKCSGEIKFPLGEWRQGEVRKNSFLCRAGRGQPKGRTNTITIEKIDFVCRGVAHCPQFTWLHEIEGQAEPSDYRRYVFAPGLGEITHDRLR